jgi:hypothetical protein
MNATPDTVESLLSNINYGKWTHSMNEEHWSATEGFDTKEEAVADGETQYEDEPFFVGVMGRPALPVLEGEFIRVTIEEQMADSEYGYEGRPEWPVLSKGETDELEGLVYGVIEEFLKKTNNMPDWFCVEQVELIS